MLLGPLAQLVEHLTLNQQVPGSSPGRPTNKIRELGAFCLTPFLLCYMQVIFWREMQVLNRITTPTKKPPPSRKEEAAAIPRNSHQILELKITSIHLRLCYRQPQLEPHHSKKPLHFPESPLPIPPRYAPDHLTMFSAFLKRRCARKNGMPRPPL